MLHRPYGPLPLSPIHSFPHPPSLSSTIPPSLPPYPNHQERSLTIPIPIPLTTTTISTPSSHSDHFPTLTSWTLSTRASSTLATATRPLAAGSQFFLRVCSYEIGALGVRGHFAFVVNGQYVGFVVAVRLWQTMGGKGDGDE